MADAIPCLRYGVSVQTSTMNELQTPSERSRAIPTTRSPSRAMATCWDCSNDRRSAWALRPLSQSSAARSAFVRTQSIPSSVPPIVTLTAGAECPSSRAPPARERRSRHRATPCASRCRRLRIPGRSRRPFPSSERSTRSWIPAASRAPRSSKRRAMSCSSSRSTGGVAGAEGSALSVGSTSRPSIAISKTRSGSSIPRR